MGKVFRFGGREVHVHWESGRLWLKLVGRRWAWANDGFGWVRRTRYRLDGADVARRAELAKMQAEFVARLTPKPFTDRRAGLTHSSICPRCGQPEIAYFWDLKPREQIAADLAAHPPLCLRCAPEPGAVVIHG